MFTGALAFTRDQAVTIDIHGSVMCDEFVNAITHDL